MATRRWNRNFHYHDLLLDGMPSPCRDALDVGCGEGTLVRRLAERAVSVAGIDISAEMIARARRAIPNAGVALIHDDFLAHDFGERRFDFITCVAAIHHMDFRAALKRMSSLLRPGGTAAVVGLARASTLRDRAFHAAGILASPVVRRGCELYNPGAPVVEPTLTYTEVERTAAQVLPGAVFRRLLLVRYLLTWRKPSSTRP